MTGGISGLNGLATIVVVGVSVFAAFVLLMIVPSFILAALLPVAAIGIVAFYVWHMATRQR